MKDDAFRLLVLPACPQALVERDLFVQTSVDYNLPSMQKGQYGSESPFPAALSSCAEAEASGLEFGSAAKWSETKSHPRCGVR